LIFLFPLLILTPLPALSVHPEKGGVHISGTPMTDADREELKAKEEGRAAEKAARKKAEGAAKAAKAPSVPKAATTTVLKTAVSGGGGKAAPPSPSAVRRGTRATPLRHGGDAPTTSVGSVAGQEVAAAAAASAPAAGATWEEQQSRMQWMAEEIEQLRLQEETKKAAEEAAEVGMADKGKGKARACLLPRPKMVPGGLHRSLSQSTRAYDDGEGTSEGAGGAEEEAVESGDEDEDEDEGDDNKGELEM
jgi:hypothetical protein